MRTGGTGLTYSAAKRRDPGGEPLWRAALAPCSVPQPAVAAKARVNQAAPGNYPAYYSCPAPPSATVNGSRLIDGAATPWVVRGSRLFRTTYRPTHAGMDLAGTLVHEPKRLPSRTSRFAAYDGFERTFSTSAACASVLALVSNQINLPSLNR